MAGRRNGWWAASVITLDRPIETEYDAESVVSTDEVDYEVLQVVIPETDVDFDNTFITRIADEVFSNIKTKFVNDGQIILNQEVNIDPRTLDT